MNILFLSSWYPAVKEPNTGIFVKEHAHAIHSSGHNTTVLALTVRRSAKLWHKTVSDFIDEAGVRTVLIEIETKFRDIVYFSIPLQFVILKGIYTKRIAPTFLPDIIHSNVIFPAGIIGYWFSKFTHKPYIITEHWSRIAGFIQKPILGYWGTKAYQHAAFILPVSIFLQKNIQSIFPNLENRQFKVIGNVVNSAIFYAHPKIQNDGLIRVCAIASWNVKKIPDKMPELFIQALSRVQKQKNIKIILTMIGGGNQLELLKKLCAKMHLETNFTGYLDKKEIARILHESDFLVHASTVETFGVGVAEALMTGTPVICSNVGALPELVNPKNGVLCHNSVDDWAAGIEHAISNKYNHQEIAEKTKANYNQHAIGTLIDAVYNITK